MEQHLDFKHFKKHICHNSISKFFTNFEAHFLAQVFIDFKMSTIDIGQSHDDITSGKQ